MGDYTRFSLEVVLKENTPKEIMDVLNYLFNEDRDQNKPGLPDWFYLPRGDCTIRDLGGYFSESSSFDGKDLKIRSSLKQGVTVFEPFFKWLTPWIDAPEGAEVGECCFEWYNPAPVVLGQPVSSGTDPEYYTTSFC